MGCKKLQTNFLRVVHCQKGSSAKKNVSDYFSFGMPMPNRQLINGEPYRYAYQGQELDPETGKVAFQLRLYDPRINRWLTVDPYGQHASPYLAMGNNPISNTDPDGGLCVDADNNTIPCPDGYSEFAGPTQDTAIFIDGEYAGVALDEISITSQNHNNQILQTLLPPVPTSDFNINDVTPYLQLALSQLEKVNVGELKNSGGYRIYYNNPSGTGFKGNQYVILHNVGKYAKIGGHIFTVLDLSKSAYKVATTSGHEQEMATQGLFVGTSAAAISYYYPPIGIVFTVGTILINTDEYKEGLHNAKVEKWRKVNLGPYRMPQGLEFKPRN